MKYFTLPKQVHAITLLLILLLLTGCASNTTANRTQDVDVDIQGVIQQAAGDLLKNTRGLAPGKPLIAATFVNVDNLQQTSTLGRMLSETFSSSLTRSGQTVIEVKMRDSLFIQERTGELILSREVRSLSASHDSQAVLLGTYAQGGTHVYVNIRIVRTTDNVILGSKDLRLPLNRDIRAMLPSPGAR
ncbi:FlgO family outer membrane protein [Nitrincola alkalilacustris]|uniref:FlgO family outer membrane protein n=1 Tax=Nitrincola alkalilacustris TaxID=1571224 RepID=UPI00124D1202|nr:FlgO family outer membrane protein [Nitrincola alkalilacustris]